MKSGRDRENGSHKLWELGVESKPSTVLFCHLSPQRFPEDVARGNRCVICTGICAQWTFWECVGVGLCGENSVFGDATAATFAVQDFQHLSGFFASRLYNVQLSSRAAITFHIIIFYIWW